MISISLCMIVKDEESCLGNCLSSVKDLVDEMIVVDTGSTDRTPDIIKEYCGDNIPTFTWINDFSAARNYAFSLATKDYILWLDADDILKPEDQKKFLELKQSLSSEIDYVSMIYDITFNEKGECTLSIPRDKLIKNHKGYYWRYFVHEELVVWGKLQHSDIHITHTSDHGHYSRYLKNYEQRLADGYELLPHEKYFYGGELFMSKDYEKCITVLEDFLTAPSDNAFEITRSYDFLRTCYKMTNQLDLAITATLRSFTTTIPKADVCYALAQLFMEKKSVLQAIFWYELIVKMPLEGKTKDLRIATYLQLCVCYYEAHQVERSMWANDQVLLLDPKNASALHNQTVFASLNNGA